MNAITTASGFAGPCQPWTDRQPYFLGMDLGSETLKVAALIQREGRLCRAGQWSVEHHKNPGPALLDFLRTLDRAPIGGAVVTGAYANLVNLPAAPAKQALSRGCRLLLGPVPATVVSIGACGFSVLELRQNHLEVYRRNSRCSQGTGNFLRQLLERFSLSVEEASTSCAEEANPAVLSARCPVILKTDVTHLANTGEARPRILAGCFDAVCENVLALMRPAAPGPVVLAGGVCRLERVRRTLTARLNQMGMDVQPLVNDEGWFLEAIGCAVLAAEYQNQLPALEALLRPPPPMRLNYLPPLASALSKVKRLSAPACASNPGDVSALVLGLDVGSTGAKAVAINGDSGQPVWEAYRRTLGDPVGAAQGLVKTFLEAGFSSRPTVAVGVTGSGREIVGGLLTSCFSKEPVFVLNEIAAHAEGAKFYDPRVDTIFEIGGQDAKYIRLADGRVVDCAMNEACSAGTGSFLEEQGSKLGGFSDVAELGCEALQAEQGVSLGQHCSVFMAEMIDQAVRAGISCSAIVAGLYDSIIQNYLHRVKGNRSVGQVIFCQGMPFAADALAAAVARRTGSEVMVPPNPGTVGALGIALLARREIGVGQGTLELSRFLTARVIRRDGFVCRADVGCGGAGQRCRIERLATMVQNHQQNFTWGGGCALHDRATRKVKLPDRAPDPFREREALVEALAQRMGQKQGRPRIGLTDEFMLKGLFPFFARFLSELGFDLEIIRNAGMDELKVGIQRSNVPFCAPLQLYRGVVAALARTTADYIFAPRLRSLPRLNGEPCAVTCPISQAAAEMLRQDLRSDLADRLRFPVLDIGKGNLASPEFQRSCEQLARDFGASGRWQNAWEQAVAEQTAFDRQCQEIGQHALAFCAEHQIPAVVVLGRDYTIHNAVLNSHVPTILREQGALPIPVDCYPVSDALSSFEGIYWGHSQRALRAAHQIRRTPGVYSVYCSNYSCGPDSFGLQFFSYIMAGKPFAVIETDGHAGDAGTRTRIEAFLHCVCQDTRLTNRPDAVLNEFHQINRHRLALGEIREAGETLWIPWMGRDAAVLAAALRGFGVRAQALPIPDAETLAMGRRHTSGKECLPLCLTLGGILQHTRNHPQASCAVLIPRSCGPCRLGMYRLLDRIVFEQTGVRIRVYSPSDQDYFADLPGGAAILTLAGLVAHSYLTNALLEVRPDETSPGAANEIFACYQAKLLRCLETPRTAAGLSLPGALAEVVAGRLFGLTALVNKAAEQLAAIRASQVRPTVLVVGEIYVRLDPFANDHVLEKLEQRGLRARLAPLSEWLDYCSLLNEQKADQSLLGQWINSRVQRRIQDELYQAVASSLQWPKRLETGDFLAASRDYLRPDLQGEAVLTLGGALAEWRAGRIDGVLSLGPLECMPNKIAEAQFSHAAEQEHLISLTLSCQGEPLDDAALDNFAFEVKQRHQADAVRLAECHQSRSPACPQFW